MKKPPNTMTKYPLYEVEDDLQWSYFETSAMFSFTRRHTPKGNFTKEKCMEAFFDYVMKLRVSFETLTADDGSGSIAKDMIIRPDLNKETIIKSLGKIKKYYPFDEFEFSLISKLARWKTIDDLDKIVALMPSQYMAKKYPPRECHLYGYFTLSGYRFFEGCIANDLITKRCDINLPDRLEYLVFHIMHGFLKKTYKPYYCEMAMKVDDKKALKGIVSCEKELQVLTILSFWEDMPMLMCIQELIELIMTDNRNKKLLLEKELLAIDKKDAGVLQSVKDNVDEFIDCVNNLPERTDKRIVSGSNGRLGVEIMKMLKEMPPRRDAKPEECDNYISSIPLSEGDVCISLIGECEITPMTKSDNNFNVSPVSSAELRQGFKNLQDKKSKWLDMLKETFRGDPDTVRLVQHIFGQSLIGNPTNTILFVEQGSNSPGTTLLSCIGNCLPNVMMDYTDPDVYLIPKKATVKMELLLAGLRKARISFVNGLPRSDLQWRVSLLKAISGGDRMRAREVHKSEFEFTPRVMPVVVTDDLPPCGIMGSDEVLKRRVKVVPMFGNPSFDFNSETMNNIRGDVLAWLICGLRDFYQRNPDIKKDMIGLHGDK